GRADRDRAPRGAVEVDDATSLTDGPHVGRARPPHALEVARRVARHPRPRAVDAAKDHASIADREHVARARGPHAAKRAGHARALLTPLPARAGQILDRDLLIARIIKADDAPA